MVDDIETALPGSLLERATMIELILTAYATGTPKSEQDDPDRTYRHLRREFMAEPALRFLLPDFVRDYRRLDAFWPFIKAEAGSYAERRQYISVAFTPLIDHLEGRNNLPGDASTSDTFESFDENGVNAMWQKALDRRNNDPEGAITAARSLLETVTKTILDDNGEVYGEKDDLPKLYARAAKCLSLTPNQHIGEPIKAILGGAMNLVNGLGTLRNRLSDSHGRSARFPVRPSKRHANLAVNMAGAMAAFLVETHKQRQE